ncbi:DUF4297 domain-containing protein [Elizabethkingia anophelis]|uniref:DUF4297 domain-containing protein n=1 Tax=Elizabethkingia anophelis TaxID=1117645 RepID=UPI0021A389F4|nr:DUF4297 domain-containing protein [Elizabethkingia anophelis]MCT3780468.1 DUF4297 domain-containing protein [Elizabethkingia anophelis]
MSLKQKFKKVIPRENAGSMASNRFDFQKNWAICKLIELLTNTSSDFLLAFEYHEDIIILDSSIDPNQIDFFQVKTKDRGTYSLRELLNRKKSKTGESGSILGKLFNNKINFNEETKSLNIVSNTTFKLNKGSNVSLICCNELTEVEKKEIEEKLGSETSTKWIEDFFDIIFFHTSELTTLHHNEITKDKLNRLIETLYTTDVKYNLSLAYRTVFDEVNRRNNIEKNIENFEDLVKYKAISRKDFEKILSIVISIPDKLDVLEIKIFNSLDQLGINILTRKKMKEAWKDIQIQYLTIDNDFFFKCVEIIKNSITNNLNKLTGNLLDSMEFIYKDIEQHKTIKSQKIFNEYQLKVIILKEFYDE